MGSKCCRPDDDETGDIKQKDHQYCTSHPARKSRKELQMEPMIVQVNNLEYAFDPNADIKRIHKHNHLNFEKLYEDGMLPTFDENKQIERRKVTINHYMNGQLPSTCLYVG